MKKRASEKYYIIMSLILGLIVLSLTLYFIFNEYFTRDELDWQECRQSIVLRANMPDYKVGMFTAVSFKDSFPLKCRTQIVEISKKDIESKKHITKIGDAFAECWTIYGNGDYDLFPSKFFGKESICVPCIRIRLKDDAIQYLTETKQKIDIESILNTRFQDSTYLDYLSNSGKQFSAFNPAFGRPFELNGEEFSIDTKDSLRGVLKNKQTGNEEDGGYFFNLLGGIDFNKVSLPKYLDHKKGDLLVIYGNAVSSSDAEGGIGPHIPYLFYFQVDQDSNPFAETGKFFIKGPLGGVLGNNAKMCSLWEGVPA